MGDESDGRSGRDAQAARVSAREERLAQALRANLKRRKDQARGRGPTGAAHAPGGDAPRDGSGPSEG